MRFINTLLAAAMAMATVVTAAPTSSSTAVSPVNTVTVVHITTEVSVFDPNDGVSGIEADGTLLVEADNAGCPRATRYACGQYMLADGTRQDFVSQVFNCIARDKFICQKFDYQLSHPTHPGEASYMVAAKIDPGCSCTFYSAACDGNQYTETWDGWESAPGSPPWNRPAFTDKKFVGWWCMEYY